MLSKFVSTHLILDLLNQGEKITVKNVGEKILNPDDWIKLENKFLQIHGFTTHHLDLK